MHITLYALGEIRTCNPSIHSAQDSVSVAHTGEMRNVHNILVRKPYGKPKHRWDNNEMELSMDGIIMRWSWSLKK
jgi:hypothetical protein